MNRNTWQTLGPSLLIAAGILAGTLAVRLAGSGAWLAGPLVLGVAVIAADTLDRRRQGAAAGPSRRSLVLAGLILAVGTVIAELDAGSLSASITSLGMAAWIALRLRSPGRCLPANPQ